MSSAPPAWFTRGIGNIWLPDTQMKTAGDPLPVARTQGSRIYLADGRELIDGIASWWTVCHGYNHPHIRAAVSEQLGRMRARLTQDPIADFGHWQPVAKM